MSDLKPTFNEELISAYVDGQLSDQERASVERRLAESPELRHICADMRLLRENLKLLPTYKLDGGFSDRVLRRADQVATDVKKSAPSGSDHQAGQSEQVPITQSRPIGNWRTLVWGVAAVAAAVLLMLALPDRHRQADVAFHAADGPGQAPASAATEPSPEAVAGDSFSAGPVARSRKLAQTVEPKIAARGAALDGRERVELNEAPSGGPSRRSGTVGTQRMETVPHNLGRGETARPYALDADGPPPPKPSPLRRRNGTAPPVVAAYGLPPTTVLDGISNQLVAANAARTGAQYVVQVVVAQAGQDLNAFDRSLARNKIHFTGETPAPSRNRARAESQRNLAYRVSAPQSSDADSMPGGPQWVFVSTDAQRFQATVNELAQNRDHFSTVRVFQIASQKTPSSQYFGHGENRNLDASRELALPRVASPAPRGTVDAPVKPVEEATQRAAQSLDEVGNARAAGQEKGLSDRFRAAAAPPLDDTKGAGRHGPIPAAKLPAVADKLRDTTKYRATPDRPPRPDSVAVRQELAEAASTQQSVDQVERLGRPNRRFADQRGAHVAQSRSRGATSGGNRTAARARPTPSARSLVLRPIDLRRQPAGSWYGGPGPDPESAASPGSVQALFVFVPPTAGARLMQDESAAKRLEGGQSGSQVPPGLSRPTSDR